ncbi:hypothetical protein SCANM63S_07590 [Streptomyces canarius]
MLHVKGRVLAGPDDVRDELWVVGGRVSYDRPAGARDTTTVEGWALPGLVDAHCHVGLGAEGPVDTETAEKQALTDRETGTLLIRDAGSPSDTRWIDDRDDLPKIIRAGRHIARTRRYIRNYAWEIEPDALVAHVAREARRGDGWVKLVGDWIDRDLGDLAPCWPREAVEAAIAEAHRLGARVTAHCFAENSLRDLVEAGIDCIEHATGLTEDLIPLFAERGVAIVPTLVNIATFPGSRTAARRSSRAGPPICAGCTSGATTPCAPLTTPASRSSSARTPAAHCRTGWSRRRSPNWSPPASRRPTRSPPPAGPPAPGSGRPRTGGRRPGRPRGVRERSPGGRTGAGGAPAGGAERTGGRVGVPVIPPISPWNRIGVRKRHVGVK